LEHNIYDCPHNSIAQEMFRNEVSLAKQKNDEIAINMVLTIETKSHTQRLVLQWEKELQKTKIEKDWEKQE